MSSQEEIRGFKKEEYFGWRAQDILANNYTTLCEEACSNKEIFSTFKSNPYYRPILEHVTEKEGQEYLNIIFAQNPKILKNAKLFKENDRIGSPELVGYKKPFSLGNISPTTIRYMKVLSDLDLLFKDLGNKNIVEIGGGYGGLALVLSKKYNFKSYVNIDLKEASMLFLKYCDENNVVGVSSKTPEQIFDFDKIDLVISNYAFSECNSETQDLYIENILSKSKRGYITHNTSEKRRNRTKNLIKNYENFRVYDYDVGKKQHPIFVWGK
ncbi:MAG: hypothetical protein CL811_10860 [Colwelliaceae bacterium]|nr:hypothetical protein [Colwelliaceae bacterium]|tara:strand:- start:1276 stop:2082 length:807 start_codon:yes stop_codon:yes gene_type:complete